TRSLRNDTWLLAHGSSIPCCHSNVRLRSMTSEFSARSAANSSSATASPTLDGPPPTASSPTSRFAIPPPPVYSHPSRPAVHAAATGTQPANRSRPIVHSGQAHSGGARYYGRTVPSPPPRHRSERACSPSASDMERTARAAVDTDHGSSSTAPRSGIPGAVDDTSHRSAWATPRLGGRPGVAGWEAAVSLDVRGQVCLDGGRQGHEDVVLADPVDEAGGGEGVVQLVFDPGEGEDHADVTQLPAQLVQGIDRGDVDVDVGLGVEQEPFGRRVGGLGRGQRSAGEIVGVDETELRVVP